MADTPSVVPPPPPPPPPGPIGSVGMPPIGPPQVDMRASREMQQWIERLERQNRKLHGRNRLLGVALALGVLALVGAVWAVYAATIGTYATLSDVAITRNPASQGRVDISYRVDRPGKVVYRRTSGQGVTNLVDYFRTPGEIHRSWAWPYTPGADLSVSVWSRGWLGRSRASGVFPTVRQADIVFLIDTTGSMTRYIAELQEKCVDFSRRLAEQELECRFALLGFGDRQEGPWLDRYAFTSDVGTLRESVGKIKRFDGGDLPESALDALEEALQLPLEAEATRRFYLVTDAPYHEPTQGLSDAAAIAQRLQEQRVLLYVFCRPEYEADYKKLLGPTGRFLEIENFGRILSEGRVLED